MVLLASSVHRVKIRRTGKVDDDLVPARLAFQGRGARVALHHRDSAPTRAAHRGVPITVTSSPRVGSDCEVDADESVPPTIDPHDVASPRAILKPAADALDETSTRQVD